MKDSRGLLAITVSILVFLIWYSFVVPKFWPKEEAKEEVAKEEVTAKDVASAESAPVMGAPASEGKTHLAQRDIKEVVSRLETEKFAVTFTNYGAYPTRWELKGYTVRENGAEEPISLVPSEDLPVAPLGLSFEKLSVGIPEKPRFDLVEAKKDLLRYQWSSIGLAIEKVYTVGEGEYDVGLKVVIRNAGGTPINGQFSLVWTAAQQKEKDGGFLGFLKRPSDIKTPVYMLDGKVTRERSPAKIKKEEIRSGRLYWAGIEDRYFLTAIVPRGEGEQLGVEMARFGEGDKAGFSSGVALPEATIAPKGAQEYNFTVYAGPKDMHILKAVGMNLEKAIDFGWFTVIAIPILYVLKFLYSVVHNYGVAIILLTILIKLLLHPISKKSMKSMKGMQQLQPRMKELKEKYKDDKERLNLEMMQLFKTHKVNPMSGCLPMVLQFPVYIALYRVLWNSIELYQAPFFWFYKDLSQPDPYFITPVLLGVAMLLQQKMTPSATADPMQQKMMMIMPLMFAVFLAFLPVGLVIYILVNTVMTVVQQWMNNNDIHLRDLIRGKIPRKAKV